MTNPLTVAQQAANEPPINVAIVSGATSGGDASAANQIITNTEIGGLTETAPATDTASSGMNGRLQRVAQRLSSIIALLPTGLGSGGGLKVDGSGTALPMSAASLPLPGGASTEATLAGVLTVADFDTKSGALTETAPATDTASSGLNGRLQRIAQRLTSIITLLPASLGSKAAASSLAVTQSTEDVAATGGVTETAPATDTASSGLNGRLQRVAQRISSLIALVPTALGRTAAASSFATVLSTEDLAAINAITTAINSNSSTPAPLNSDGTNGSAVPSKGQLVQGSDGTNARNIATTTGGVVKVDLSGTAANATAVKVDGSAVTQPVAGDVASGSSDSGNPVKIGAKAVNAEPTALTTGQRANIITDLVGKQIVLPYANPENFVSGAITSAMTSTTSTSLVAAPAAGLRNYITTIIVSNSHATVGTDVIIQDGSGGTTLLTIPAAAVYGGAAITLPVPLRQPTTATALFCANVTTGSNTKVSVVGYKGV